MRRFLLLFVFLNFAGVAVSQVAINSSEDIIQELENLSFENSAMDITGYSFLGDTAALGVFNRIEGPFPLDFGLVISSGFATRASTGGFVDNDGLNGDADLFNLNESGSELFDCSALEIHFTALEDELNVSFVFASDEYDGFTCSNFIDPFGIFLKKDQDGEEFENLAFVPETEIPVSVNSLNNGFGSFNTTPCDEANPNWEETFIYYLENNLGEYGLFVPGMTVALPAQVPLEIGQEYVLKLAAGDMGDPFFDTYGFLSFSGAETFDCPLIEMNVGDTCTIGAETIELIGSNCECTEYVNGVDFALDLNPNSTTIDPGDTVFVEVTVQNFGAAISGDFTINLYRSLDFQLDETDELILTQIGTASELFNPQYFEFAYFDYPIPYQNFRLFAEIVSDEDTNLNNPISSSFVNFTPNTPCEVFVPEGFSPLVIEPTATEIDFSYGLYNPGPSTFIEVDLRVYWSQVPNFISGQGLVFFAETFEAEDVMPGDTVLVETTLNIPPDYVGEDAYLLLFPREGSTDLLECEIAIDVVSGFLSSGELEFDDWTAWIDPARGLMISAGNIPSENLSVYLFDPVGRIVFEGNLPNENGVTYAFDLPELSSGIYLLRIGNTESSKTFRLPALR